MLDPDLREYLRDTVLGASLRDTDRAMLLGADGEYQLTTRRDIVDRFNAQAFLLARHTTECAREPH